jgi:hypothetical protein
VTNLSQSVESKERKKLPEEVEDHMVKFALKKRRIIKKAQKPVLSKVKSPRRKDYMPVLDDNFNLSEFLLKQGFGNKDRTIVN